MNPNIEEINATTSVRWIKCSEAMPDEHDSIFKKYEETEWWRQNMWTKKSKTVDITVEYEDGSRRTGTGKTYDGKWRTDVGLVETGRVIAWRPRPEPYSGKE